MHRVAKTLVLTIAIMVNPGALVAKEAAPALVEKSPAWSVEVAPASEPGTRMIVRGRLLATDGKTSLNGVAIRVWQTDASGLYSLDGSLDEPRLRAKLVTGPKGEYELRTIRPAAYPNRSIPAHIHYRVTYQDRSQEFEVRFDDDLLVSKSERDRSREQGATGTVQRVRVGEDGIQYVTRDLRLR